MKQSLKRTISIKEFTEFDEQMRKVKDVVKNHKEELDRVTE